MMSERKSKVGGQAGKVTIPVSGRALVAYLSSVCVAVLGAVFVLSRGDNNMAAVIACSISIALFALGWRS